MKRAYTTYHGSDEGLDKLIAMAKTSTAPGDLHIDSVVEIAERKAAADAAAAAADPAMAMWKTIKEGLTGASPDAFFDGSVKDALLPGKNPTTGADLKFKGKLVSMKPALRPKTLVLSVQDPQGDVTLNFEMALPGKMELGAELEFAGEAKAYTKEPFMLTLEAEKENIVGWKPVAPTPAPKKAVPAKKKAQ